VRDPSRGSRRLASPRLAELLTCQVAMFIVTLVSYIRNHDGKRSRCWRRTAAMNCPWDAGLKA